MTQNPFHRGGRREKKRRQKLTTESTENTEKTEKGLMNGKEARRDPTVAAHSGARVPPPISLVGLSLSFICIYIFSVLSVFSVVNAFVFVFVFVFVFAFVFSLSVLSGLCGKKGCPACAI
jgi:hypothetical protein